jgi:DNA-binding NarL/FixJ family response regulator
MLTRRELSAYADSVTETSTAADLAGALDSADPRVGLRAVASLRILLERVEALQVAGARAHGWSWQEIADQLGVSKQTVHRKYHRRI